jgi:hypothetical protein
VAKARRTRADLVGNVVVITIVTKLLDVSKFVRGRLRCDDDFSMQLHGNATSEVQSNPPESEISSVHLHACAVHCGRYSPDHVQAAEVAVVRFGDNAPSAREHLGCTGVPGSSNHGD